MKKNKLKNVWDKYYDEDKRDIVVPEGSIFEYFYNSSQDKLDLIALNYFNKKISYRELILKIDVVARSLKASGVRKNDVVTICMPNTPEAVIAFYAVNKIGAIANMIHPLSSEEEIKHSLITTKSVLMITINLSYEKVNNIIDDTDLYKVVVVSPKDSMPSLMSLGYYLMKELKMDINYSNSVFIVWDEFYNIGLNYDCSVECNSDKDSDAIYLHSGGTTGIPKNIVLTNGNVNSVMEQAKIIFPKIGTDDTFLGILPMFHCFGLVVCICAPLIFGSTIALIPQFDAKRFDKLIRQYNPTILTGVPTLYEALLTNPYMINVDMSMVKYVVSGGDSLSPEKCIAVNKFMKEHNCNKKVMQGYGMTESTGPVCIGSFGSDKPGSVGIPLPGNNIRIFDSETKKEKKYGEVGEICISGPTVMSRYLNNKEETNKMIIEHDDGIKWIHTGDLGYMDEDGVIFFVQRLKRMLIVSGYNVYPSYIEEVLLKHPAVQMCGVIGVPHPYKVQVPKAYIVLKDEYKESYELLDDIKYHCKLNLSKYMLPKEYVFRDSLPKTMIGKVDYKVLEKEND